MNPVLETLALYEVAARYHAAVCIKLYIALFKYQLASLAKDAHFLAGIVTYAYNTGDLVRKKWRGGGAHQGTSAAVSTHRHIYARYSQEYARGSALSVLVNALVYQLPLQLLYYNRVNFRGIEMAHQSPSGKR